jgi:hypothetical protein
MRQFSKIAIAVLVLWLTACDTSLRRAQTPPTPQPAAAKPETPPAPDEPLSTPQTHVLLPQPQPIDAEALATPEVYTPTEPSTAHTSRKPAKHPSPQSAAATVTPPKPETAEADAPPAAESQRPAIEPVLPANQRRQMTEEISSRLKEVDQVLGRAAARGLSNPQKTAMDTIRSFRDLSYQALEHGDIQKAGGLADRALLLAQELDRAR